MSATATEGPQAGRPSPAAPSAGRPLRDAVVEGYGCVVTKSHPNSIWRRDLAYPKRGLHLEVRPMTPDDDQREADFFQAQTLRERALRFLGITSRLSADLIRRFTHLNFARDFAVVAVDRSTDELVGVARYVRTRKDPTEASIAVAVLQKYQRLGLGQYLLSAVVDAAIEHGLQTLHAEISVGNFASRRLLHKVCQQASASRELTTSDGDTNEFRYRLPKPCSGSEKPIAAKAEEPKPDSSAASAPLAFAVDNSRHPRSLWRHDLVFSSGLRLEVRPADADDAARAAAFFAAGGPGTGGDDTEELLDFTSGFTLVALDVGTDALVCVAHFSRGADCAKMSVLTAPGYRGLGVADYMTAEVLRAARAEVMPRVRSSL